MTEPRPPLDPTDSYHAPPTAQPEPDRSPLPASQPDPRLGTKLHKYQLLRHVGQGGMGVVYEAEDLILKRRVAIKCLSRTLTENAKALQRFIREAQAVARVVHPNIVTIHDVSEYKGEHYLVMELVRGESVQTLLDRQQRLPWLEATRIILQACAGLQEAHVAGLIHRDIKPGNLLLRTDGTVKVADFGLAKQLRHGGALTTTGKVLGTPHFMSPEQIRNQHVDHRTDIYALGVTYYVLLTGHLPFELDDVFQLMYAQCSNPRPDPAKLAPELPPSCSLITRTAMSIEPGDRFSTAKVMQQVLKQLLATYDKKTLTALPVQALETQKTSLGASSQETPETSQPTPAPDTKYPELLPSPQPDTADVSLDFTRRKPESGSFTMRLYRRFQPLMATILRQQQLRRAFMILVPVSLFLYFLVSAVIWLMAPPADTRLRPREDLNELINRSKDKPTASSSATSRQE